MALRLEEAGLEYRVFDDAAPTGASRNAAGICKLSWYRQETVRKMIDGVFTYAEFMRGFSWLADRVAIAKVPERFVNAGRGTEKVHDDNYLADPAELLGLGRVMTTPVDKLYHDRNRVVVHTPDEGDFYCSQVVVAAGVGTDKLLADSGLGAPTGVQPLWGRAMLFDCAEPPVCTTVMTRPYRHYTFREFRGRVRGGDTVERGERNDKHMDDLFVAAARLFGELSDVTVFGGIRPVCRRMYVGRVSPQVIAATGGHRVGFGLAGAVSERVFELLGTSP
ncbi:MAG TPA: FAD-dependent oxidoreductase [Nocardioidaceae bacterium]|nr:FAD-dependent oxidoreductase [Nocardioidaceae bacterium]